METTGPRRFDHPIFLLLVAGAFAAATGCSSEPGAPRDVSAGGRAAELRQAVRPGSSRRGAVEPAAAAREEYREAHRLLTGAELD